ncbi:MAG TPA: hypothetical protein VIN04_13220 [Myxococcota bacterium]
MELGAMEATRSGVVDAETVARALALLDRGRADEARALLAEALAAAESPLAADGGFARFDDAELEDAFEEARPETESMIDADGIAFEAIVRARLDEPEQVALPAPDSPFYTRTMADLLERQGDPAAAQAIRAALDTGAPDPARARAAAARARTLETLERWLARLRGGEA